jgi:hypothetical protein
VEDAAGGICGQVELLLQADVRKVEHAKYVHPDGLDLHMSSCMLVSTKTCLHATRRLSSLTLRQLTGLVMEQDSDCTGDIVIKSSTMKRCLAQWHCQAGRQAVALALGECICQTTCLQIKHVMSNATFCKPGRGKRCTLWSSHQSTLGRPVRPAAFRTCVGFTCKKKTCDQEVLSSR